MTVTDQPRYKQQTKCVVKCSSTILFLTPCTRRHFPEGITAVVVYGACVECGRSENASAMYGTTKFPLYQSVRYVLADALFSIPAVAASRPK